MFFCRIFSLLLLVLLVNFRFLQASEPASNSDWIQKRFDVPELNLVILHLNNGMRVCLKQTEEDDEVAIHLIAEGGLSALPDSLRVSAKLAPQVALRSGIGEYHYDKLHVFLYDHSIDLNIHVMPFSRHIEATSKEEEMPSLVRLLSNFFTSTHFSKFAFSKEQEKMQLRALSGNRKENQKGFEESYLEFNHPSISVCSVFKPEDYKKADYQSSKGYFENHFTDPSDFVCVIVGSFNMDKAISLVKTNFSTIPGKKKGVKNHFEPFASRFPEEKTRKKIIEEMSVSDEAMTAITIPISVEVTEHNFTFIENLVSLLRIHLKNEIRRLYGSEIAVRVTLDSPFYPFLKGSTIKILYISPSKQIAAVEEAIIAELKKMQKDPIPLQEIALMLGKHKKNMRLRKEDHAYWIVILFNCTALDWRPTALPGNFSPLAGPEKVRDALKIYFSLDRYTLLSSGI